MNLYLNCPIWIYSIFLGLCLVKWRLLVLVTPSDWEHLDGFGGWRWLLDLLLILWEPCKFWWLVHGLRSAISRWRRDTLSDLRFWWLKCYLTLRGCINVEYGVFQHLDTMRKFLVDSCPLFTSCIYFTSWSCCALVFARSSWVPLGFFIW